MPFVPETLKEQVGITEEVFATIEYGDPDLITDNEGPLYAYIRFPQAGDIFDYIIARWAHEVHEVAVKETNELRRVNPSGEGEINIQFDSYFVDERYVGIMETGMYINSHMSRPRDIIQPFNFDTEKGFQLDNRDIINPLQNDKLLILLKERIGETYPDSAGLIREADESWLEHLAIGHEGIIVAIGRGKALPASFGILSVTLPYDEIAFALRLGEEIAETGQAGGQQATGGLPSFLMSYEVDPSLPMVALTFDDGPSKHTAQILDLLEKHNARATFFVIGNLVESRRDTVERAYQLGCEVVGHSWDHRSLTKLSAEEIKTQILNAHAAVEAVTGSAPRMYRPPYGAVNDTVKNVSGEIGFALINWSVDPRDWESRNANAVYAAIMKNVKDRAIILSHDLYGSTADAMERVIPELIAAGYQIVTVSELFHYSGITPQAGTVYNRGQ